jgi:hypothetical protein
MVEVEGAESRMNGDVRTLMWVICILLMIQFNHVC